LSVTYCETLECINNLDEILQVPGIDVIFIGPFDLSQSLGVTGQISHPKVLAAIDDIICRTRAAGKAAGIIAATVEATLGWIAKGARYFAVSSDLGMVSSAGKQLVEGIRASLK
jgi:4-hydroxy-2-oxoheptanedioate aldolase